MHRIFVGVDGPDEVGAVIEAGASELYCGLITDGGCLNVYSTVTKANVYGFSELERVADVSHGLGVPLYLARNLRHLTQGQVDQAISEIEHAADIGIDGVIVADPALLMRIVHLGLPVKIVCSSLMPVFNSHGAAFYGRLGADRVILPKQLSLDEVREVVLKNPTLEFEVFVFFQGCRHVDPFCRTEHEKYRSHENPRRITIGTVVPPGVTGRAGHSQDVTRLTCQSTACGVCGLWALADTRDVSLKIASRGKSLARKVSATRTVKAALAMCASGNLSRAEFTRAAKSGFESAHGHSCHEYFCYCEGPWRQRTSCQRA